MPLLLPKRKAAPKLGRHKIKPTGSLRHLATRLFNTPLLVHPDKIPYYLAVLGPRMGLRGDQIPAVALDEQALTVEFDEDEDISDGEDDGNPCAVIPVFGTLVKRSTGMDSLSGLTSYDSLRASIGDALADPNCESIVLDFDSPGGEAAGMFDLCNFIASVKGQKPIVGVSNDEAYSAAYALASCCDKLLVTGVGGVGSIGVYMLHVDKSKADEMNGLDYTYIYSGKSKVDGNPHEPLSKGAKAEAQEEVDRIRQMFVLTVAGNRGVPAQHIYDTEAKTFMGNQGVPMLADGVGTLEDALSLAGTMSKASRSLWMGLSAGGQVPTKETTADVHDPIETIMHARGDASIDRAAMLTAFTACGWADIPYGKQTKGEPERLLSLRAFGSAKLTTASEESQVTGVLAPYNSLSGDLGGFREIYQAGCFAEGLREPDDAWILSHHNPEHVLGCKSAGTARFWEELDGLHYECNLPDTQVGKDLKISMERGDVKESSAAFFILQHRWEMRSTGRVRIVEKAKLIEGSPCIFAAYKESTAQVAEPKQEQLAATDVDPSVELLEARLRLLNLS